MEEGHYFFSDIIKEGTMLYDNGKHQLAEAKELSPDQRAHRAKLYFDEWFKDANNFFIDSQSAFNRESYKTAIFHLHQTAERYYQTIILVFTDYKPKEHDLERLNREAYLLDTRFKTVFPNQTDEEKRLFTLLVKAYIDSRYKLGYKVAATDLEWLGKRVQKLKELTEEICKEKIEGFKK